MEDNERDSKTVTFLTLKKLNLLDIKMTEASGVSTGEKKNK